MNYPEAAYVAYFGSQTPASVVWVNKSLKGLGITTNDGKTDSGEWIDVVVFNEWLKIAIQKQVIDCFKKVSKPSPIQIENAINVALEAGKQLGGIIRYKVTSVNVDRQNRVASFEWKAQLTNAIHSTTIKGIVTP